MRNPPWTRDEGIFTLDFYIRHSPKIPNKNSKEIKQLSELLNKLQRRIGGETPDKFRNVNGVYMKLMNFKSLDPDYGGAGLRHGNKDDAVVWNLYAKNPDTLHELVQHITSFIKSEAKAQVLPDLSEDEEESNEGQILSRVHRYRERNAGIVKKKKAQFIKEHGKLYCECCGFNFVEKYGEHGEGFIECHHTIPVSELEAKAKTKLSDLAMLCSNCHRMMHRKAPWLSIDDLKKIIN